MVERPIDTVLDGSPDSQRLQSALKRYIGRRVPACDADDLFQDVLHNLIKARPHSPIHNVAGYVFRIASNLISARRRQPRWSECAENEIDAVSDDEAFQADRILISQEELGAVMENILTLPERTRDVFILHRFEDMTYSDIAKHFNVSPSAIEKHMIKALRILSVAADAR